jgi:1,4-alpha-glucan branching enzyme
MYELFGFSRSAAGDQIQLFVPDNVVDPTQYIRGGPSRIVEVRIVSDFQDRVNGGGLVWDYPSGLVMRQLPHANGFLYTYQFLNPLPDGYYQYQYVVKFQDQSVRWIGDPCTKYGGDSDDRSAFVVGGSPVVANGLANRLPTKDLLIYELMIDDFTKNYHGPQAPLDAIVGKLDYLSGLNINAVEFMPWIAWPDDIAFSWGYNPAYFFSVESRYMVDAGNPLDRLSRLSNLVNECHKRGLHVILDIVLQHALQGSKTNGFPYYWLWQNPGTECPFVGQYVNTNNFGMLPLDYDNACTQQFIGDVCEYWMDRFNLDGFRFDQVTGYNNPQFPQKGAPGLIAELTNHIAATGRNNFSLILEDSWGFDAIADSNVIKPTGTWFDLFRSGPFGIFSGYAVPGQHVTTAYMRILNSALDFNYPIGPVIYIENHDHGSVTCRVGGRNQWFKTQPYMIALATCPGGVMLHNGQEWGQFEDIWEDDSNAPPQDARVQSRPLDWNEAIDPTGQLMEDRYRFLLKIRKDHPGLRSPNFYPDYYDQQWTSFSPEGYGLNVSSQVAIYHRWGNNEQGQLERLIVVLNFTDKTQWINVPFPGNGNWTDLLNGNTVVNVGNYWLSNYPIPSNWGRLFWQ